MLLHRLSRGGAGALAENRVGVARKRGVPELGEVNRGRTRPARQQEHEPERAPLRELRGAERQVGEDAGSLGEPDEDHHSGEEPERAPVHGLDRRIELDHTDDDHEPRADRATIVRCTQSTAITVSAARKMMTATMSRLEVPGGNL